MTRQLNLNLRYPNANLDDYLDTWQKSTEIFREAPVRLEPYLRQQLAAGRINLHDARTIWRGLHEVWITPFDTETA